MKYLLIILILSAAASAQIAPRHKFSITAGVSASRPFRSSDKFDFSKLLTTNLTLSIPVKNRYAVNFAIVQPLRNISPQFRAGVTVRIY